MSSWCILCFIFSGNNLKTWKPCFDIWLDDMSEMWRMAQHLPKGMGTVQQCQVSVKRQFVKVTHDLPEFWGSFQNVPLCRTMRKHFQNLSFQVCWTDILLENKYLVKIKVLILPGCSALRAPLTLTYWFGQIQFTIETDTIYNGDKYNLQWRQIQSTMETNTFWACQLSEIWSK